MTRGSFNWWLLYPTLSVALLAGAPQAQAPGAVGGQGRLMISSASAAGMTAHVIKIDDRANVICQKFIDDRHLLRRVRTPDGCFDEVIDTYNGHVDSRTPAPCENSC